MALPDSQTLIIFDCDGVLVDSEPISNGVMSEMIGELGWHVTVPETTATFVGRSLSSCIEIINRKLEASVPESFARDFRARCERAFEAGLKPVTGIVEALHHVPCATCVASSGDHAKIRSNLQRTGLLTRFDGHIYSASDVAHGKPAPDLFLHAAQSMGFDPRHCIVVEDTVLGVQAGVAAGMTVLAYTGTYAREPLQRAGGTTFDDMSVLPHLIDELITGRRL